MLEKTIINKEDLIDVTDMQQNIIKASENFVGMLSLRRYLSFNLLELSEEEIINLTSTLIDNDFYFDGNPLFFISDEAKNFIENKNNHVNFSKFYIENLVKGVDIQEEVLSTDTNDQFTRGDMFDEVIMTNGNLSMGDMPTLKLLLTLQKALLARIYALKNIKLLQKEEFEIYKILPTLE